MFDHGVDKTLNSYGYNKEEITNIASGSINFNDFNNQTIIDNPGHMNIFKSKTCSYFHPWPSFC